MPRTINKRLFSQPAALFALSLCSVLTAPSTLAASTTIFQHTGAVDPTTEGWNIGGSGSIGIITGPLVNDAGLGIDAWFVNDTSTVGGSNQSYYQTLSAEQELLANTRGWSLSTTIRVPNASETAAYAPFILYRDGVTSWDLAFGSEADGDPIVKLMEDGGRYPNYNGASYTLQGAGSTYHHYELIYDLATGSADLFVDGIERISGYTGRPLSTSVNMGWGSGSSIDTGQGNFHAVAFNVNPVPLPAGAWLLLSGIGALLALTRKPDTKVC